MAVLVKCYRSVDRGETLPHAERWARCGGERRVDRWSHAGTCPTCGCPMRSDWGGDVAIVAGDPASVKSRVTVAWVARACRRSRGPLIPGLYR